MRMGALRLAMAPVHRPAKSPRMSIRHLRLRYRKPSVNLLGGYVVAGGKIDPMPVIGKAVDVLAGSGSD